ncbi:MAG: 4-alpha-glucanotransferase [Acidimicrobiia bacterium]|nr:4-alpha-glucanotransferase [Acidimicrobiia bacterium]
MPDSTRAVLDLATTMGVATSYVDGLGRRVDVGNETLIAVCAALGAPIAAAPDAGPALHQLRGARSAELVPQVVVAWNGVLAIDLDHEITDVEIVLEDGTVLSPEPTPTGIRTPTPLPLGYHRIRIDAGRRSSSTSVIAAPQRAWRGPATGRRWGVGAQLAALRTSRSRSVGDVADLTALCDWVGTVGGSLVNLLPLLPTFNDPPVEPSPYSPVSRLFWSELALDLGDANVPVADPGLVDVTVADTEVRAAFEDIEVADRAADPELARYALFRGAQLRLGRDHRAWPPAQRAGHLDAEHVDPDERRFHLAAQLALRQQFGRLRTRLDDAGVQLGLDLAVGVHPDGYDVWSRPELFAHGMSVGAPPDAGFPSGQSWGFAPVHPERSAAEGHAYFAASIAHQAALADVLRIDHVMAMQRLYWIPDGMGLADGTYVQYPVEEMFAVLCLESHRNNCELIAENLGTVPPTIDRALDRHGIHGTYLAEFDAAANGALVGPSSTEVAMIDTHDTPLFAGWLEGVDIDERVRLGLLRSDAAVEERGHRVETRRALGTALGALGVDAHELLPLLLEFLGRSASPLVIVWLEDLWLESAPVNIPGSASSERPNWARPIGRTLESIVSDPKVAEHIAMLDAARTRSASGA